MRVKLCVKIWLESDGKFIMGEGTARLLRTVEEKGSLSGAAQTLKISYSHAWRKVRDIEKNLGMKVLEKKRGGRIGGSSVVTQEGKMLIEEYERLKMAAENALKEHSKLNFKASKNENWKN